MNQSKGPAAGPAVIRYEENYWNTGGRRQQQNWRRRGSGTFPNNAWRACYRFGCSHAGALTTLFQGRRVIWTNADGCLNNPRAGLTGEL